MASQSTPVKGPKRCLTYSNASDAKRQDQKATPTKRRPTPTSKRISGQAANRMQLKLQEEIKDKFVECGQCTIQRGAAQLLLGRVVSTDQVLDHAVKKCFRSVKVLKGIYHNMCGQEDLNHVAHMQHQAPIPVETTEEKISLVCRLVKKELDDLCSRSNPSILRSDNDKLKDITFEALQDELESRLPILHQIVSQCAQGSSRNKPATLERQRKGVVSALCKLTYLRNQDMNAMQKIAGLRMKLKGLNSRAITKFNYSYDSVAYATINRLQDKLSDQLDERLNLWQDSHVTHVGDNLDIRVKKRHEAASVSSYDFHLYNHVLVKSRIDVSDLDDTRPEVNVKDIDYSMFLPSKSDEDVLLTNIEHHIREAWRLIDSVKEYIPASPTTENIYVASMSLKSDVASLGVQDANENTQMIQILKYATKYPTSNHQLPSVYRGDYLTYERVKPAINAMSNTNCLPSLIPSFADFHPQMEWAQVIFDRLYDKGNCRDPGSLNHIKTILNSNQVTESVKNNYYAVSHFLDKVLDSYLITGALEWLTMTDTSCEPSVPYNDEKGVINSFIRDVFTYKQMALPLSNTCQVCGKTYASSTYLRSHINKQHPGMSVPADVDRPTIYDNVHAHTKELVKMLLIKRELDECIHAGDGDRLYAVIKHMMLYFRLYGKTKYALCCMEYMAQINIFLSPMRAELVKHERFVSTHGGANQNMAQDQHCEHLIKWIKEHFTLYRGQISEKTLNRLTKSMDEVEAILEMNDNEFYGDQRANRHCFNRDKYMADVHKAVSVMASHRLYDDRNRTLKSDKLNKSAREPLSTLDMHSMKDWLVKCVNRMATESFY